MVDTKGRKENLLRPKSAYRTLIINAPFRISFQIMERKSIFATIFGKEGTKCIVV